MAGNIDVTILRDHFGQAMVDIMSQGGHVLYEEAQDILTASQVLCPVDTGALQNSAQVSPPVVTPTGATVEIGYGGPALGYAMVVHEDVSKRHASPTGAKFLERPVNRARHGFAARVQQRLFSISGAGKP